MKITRKSSITGIEHTMDLPITQEELDRLHRGAGMIQHIFPHLNPVQREFLLTGITPEEWEKHIKTEEDD